jgi:hypothetical protein
LYVQPREAFAMRLFFVAPFLSCWVWCPVVEKHAALWPANPQITPKGMGN